MKKVMTKKEMIESLANTDAQKLIYYRRYKKIRKLYVKQAYNDRIYGGSRSAMLHQLDRYLLDASKCVKH